MTGFPVNDLRAIRWLPFSTLSGPEAGERIRDSLCDEIEGLRAERTRLRSAVRRLIEHGPDTGHTYAEFMACYEDLVREAEVWTP